MQLFWLGTAASLEQLAAERTECMW